MSDFKTILIPFDFSANANVALETAMNLGQRLGADLHLLHVVYLPLYAYGVAAAGTAVPMPFDTEGLREEAEKSLNELIAKLDYPGKVQGHVTQGANIEDLLQQSAKDMNADLIIMGTHGRSGMAHLFLGSVAERTLRNAPCPVMTVKGLE